MKIKLSMLAVMGSALAVLPAAAIELGRGPGTVYGDPYPYTQTISGAAGSFDVIMDASRPSNPQQLYVSTLFDTIGIMKSASGSEVSDERQINPDEFLEMTITNLNGGAVNFIGLSGTGSYFNPGVSLYLYKNDVPASTIICNGSGSYDIIPPIVAEEGDTVSFNPSDNVRLTGFDVTINAGFPADNEPYIPNSAATTNLLDSVISSNGHYFVMADWSGLTHKPDGVVVKVGKGNATTRLYYLGESGPTSEIDFDLLILEPGDTVRVLAGLTGDAGEDPDLWSVSMERRDSWSGTRYNVPVIPLGLATPPSGLDLYKDAWPKNVGFRNDFRSLRGQDVVFDFVSEALGHAPKCFDEELSYPSANIPILNNYVQAFTNRQALFHWNGKMVKPFLGGTLPAKMGEFKPYHFRYDAGSYLSSAINASETQIEVDDPGLFVTNEYNVAIVIPLDPTTGERSFDDAELVTVTALSGNQLTVIRNVYQSLLNYTSAGNFAAGSYIAPAVQAFERVEAGGIRYNHSLLCPKDAQGRTGSDLFAEMLSHEFAVGSNLERFQGIMFDVLPRSVDASEDCNLDGIADGGVDARGIDLYHLGVQGMGRKLRAAIPGRIITFDGQEASWPALHTVFSGMECEGFSRYNDSYTTRWSKSLNYYLFTKRWNPSSNFYNFCVTKQEDDPPEAEQRALTRFHEAGLTAMGVAVHHDPIDMSSNATGPFHALDEMRKGVENKLQWLGAPLSDLIRPGLSAPDKLGGSGLPAAGWSCPDGSATVSAGAEAVVITPVVTGIDHDMSIEFSGISIPAGDLLIRFEGKGGLPLLPSDTARAIHIEVDGRVQNGLTYDTLTGVVNHDGFTEVTAYYRRAGAPDGSTVTLRLFIEGAQEMTLRNFTIHNATDVLLREFENGVVLCNPSENPYTFDLASFFPGRQFRRIQGQSYDDPVVNDGSTVGPSVQLDGYRGLFLVSASSVIPGESYTIVNYTPFNSYKGTLPPDIDTLYGDAWTFSDTDPMVSDPGTNTVVYGGLITTWTSPEVYRPNLRNKTGALQLQINPADLSYQTAKGIYLWRKADFLTGTGSTLAFASDDTISLSTGWFAADQKNLRFVVNQGGSYYVSEFLSSGGDVTLYPSTIQWAPLNTNDYSFGAFEPLTLDDVQGVGLHMDLNRAGWQLALEVIDFQATAHIADYYTLWASGYSLTGSNALETADIEPDGMNNYLEYALGGNPTNADAPAVLPTFAVTSVANTNWMDYVYRRRNNHAARGIGYVVEVSTNLISGGWNSDQSLENGSYPLNSEFDIVTNRLPISGKNRFIRLLIQPL